MKLWIVLFAFLICSATVGPVRADEVRSPQAENDRDEEVAARAKRRAYPGGVDENELRVQDPLPVPTRKIAPVAEEPRDESSND